MMSSQLNVSSASASSSCSSERAKSTASSTRSLPQRRHQCSHTSVLSTSQSPLLRSRASQKQASHIAHTSTLGPAAPSQRAEQKLNKVYDTVIVGAGLSGLTTGQALAAKYGITNFLVTEACERVGGKVTSMQGNGFVWEEGPNSFQPSDAILQLAVDAGVADQLVLGDPTAPRFVYWENRLRPTPSGPDLLSFDLLTTMGKIRAGLGAFGLFNSSMPEEEESVEQFVRRNLGAEVFERLVEPFCSGVYAGDPAKLSMKAAFPTIWKLEKTGGSLAGGAIKGFQEKKANPAPPRNPSLPPKPAGQTVGSFRNGMQTLPEAISKNIKDTIRLSWKLQSMSKDANGEYLLQYDTPEGSTEVRAKSIVLTVPAYIAAELVKQQSPEAHKVLNAFDYPPVAAVTVSYPFTAVKDERKDAEGKVPGFGQLHPRSQGITTLGSLYSSSLFPGRAPDGSMLILNFVGGAKNRGVLNQSSEELIAQVDKDLRIMLLKPDAPPPVVVGVKVWEQAIPQFNIGHDDALVNARSALNSAGWDNVILSGNYVSGVAIGKCIEHGYVVAVEVNDIVSKQTATA